MRPTLEEVAAALGTVCPFLGPCLRTEDGAAVTQECLTCGTKFGKPVSLKVFQCLNAEWPGLEITADLCGLCKAGWK